MGSEGRAAILGLLALAALAGTVRAADDPLKGDIRDLKVGTTVDALPTQGYVHFACGNDGAEPGSPISGWAEFRRCSADASGLHEIAFQYDEDLQPWAKVNDDWEGTKVAGHPVILSLLIDDRGIAQGIRVVTDPEAHMYLKKKAFLLGIRVMGRYGRDGWQCVNGKPGDGKTPIGGMFIDRHCEKTFHDRHLILDTDLYRAAEPHDRTFTDTTRLEIFKVAG